MFRVRNLVNTTTTTTTCCCNNLLLSPRTKGAQRACCRLRIFRINGNHICRPESVRSVPGSRCVHAQPRPRHAREHQAYDCPGRRRCSGLRGVRSDEDQQPAAAGLHVSLLDYTCRSNFTNTCRLPAWLVTRRTAEIGVRRSGRLDGTAS